MKLNTICLRFCSVDGRIIIGYSAKCILKRALGKILTMRNSMKNDENLTDIGKIDMIFDKKRKLFDFFA